MCRPTQIQLCVLRPARFSEFLDENSLQADAFPEKIYYRPRLQNFGRLTTPLHWTGGKSGRKKER